MKPDRKPELQLNISFLTKTERVPCLGILPVTHAHEKRKRLLIVLVSFPLMVVQDKT